jgi:hypothetical protein
LNSRVTDSDKPLPARIAQWTSRYRCRFDPMNKTHSMLMVGRGTSAFVPHCGTTARQAVRAATNVSVFIILHSAFRI